MNFRINGMELHTRRLRLRAFAPDDLEDFFAYASVEGVGEMAGWLHHTDRQTTQKVLQHFIERDKVFAIEYEGRVVGSIELDTASAAWGGKGAMVGFVLAKHLHRQGLMSEALQAVMNYAFDRLGLDYISSGYFQNNPASEAIHRKHGFVYYAQGKHLHHDGRHMDTDFVVRIHPGYIKQTAQNVRSELQALANPKRQAFDAKLLPTVDPNSMLGLSNPQTQAIAKKMQMLDRLAFLQSLPHAYHDENMLHAMILRLSKDERFLLEQVECFCPYIDNWAVCDSIDFRRIKQMRRRLWEKLQAWRSMDLEYSKRLALTAILSNFLEDDSIDCVCNILPQIDDEAYYVHMALAWVVADGLIKQYDKVLPLLLEEKLSKKTHNKAIQKAVESYRVSEETKRYLKTLRRK